MPFFPTILHFSKVKKKDELTDSLLQQIKSLQDEQKKLDDDKALTPSEKSAKSKELTKQIAALQKQLQEHRIEAEKKEKEEALKKVQEKQQTKSEQEQQEKVKQNGGMTTAETSTLTKIGTLFSEASALNSVRTRATGKVHSLKGAIAASKSRSISSGVGSLEAQLSEAQSTVDSITNHMIKKYGEIQNTLKDYHKLKNDPEKLSEAKKVDEEKKDKKNDNKISSDHSLISTDEEKEKNNLKTNKHNGIDLMI